MQQTEDSMSKILSESILQKSKIDLLRQKYQNIREELESHQANFQSLYQHVDAQLEISQCLLTLVNTLKAQIDETRQELNLKPLTQLHEIKLVDTLPKENIEPKQD